MDTCSNTACGKITTKVHSCEKMPGKVFCTECFEKTPCRSRHAEGCETFVNYDTDAEED